MSKSTRISGRVVAFTPDGVHRLKHDGTAWVYDDFLTYGMVDGCRVDTENKGFIYYGIPGAFGVYFVQNGDATPRSLDGFAKAFAAAGVLEQIQSCIVAGGKLSPQFRAGARTSFGRVITGYRTNK